VAPERPAAERFVALDEIADQPRAIELLRRVLASDRVAHAYAFIGPSGAGRMTAALAFAAELLGSPSRQHPDLHVIVPTPPESNPKGARAIRINAIRELERVAALKPVAARRKVFVLDEAERMTADTPQAFLKTLEEPPARTVIILILSQLRALPPTVLSRCQVVRFHPRLTEGMPALLPDVRTDAHTRSLRLLVEAREQGVEAVLRLGEQIGRDRQAAETFVEACWLWHRDLLCGLAGAPARLMIRSEAQAAGRERSLERLTEALRDCREAWLAIQGNVSPRLTVEVLLGRLTGLAA